MQAVNTSMALRLSRLAAEAPGAVAITTDVGNISRGALDSRSDDWARELVARGVVYGDRVAFVLPDGGEFLAVLIAIWKVGGVPLALNFKLSDRELAGMLDVAAPRLVVGRALEPVDGRVYLPMGHEPGTNSEVELDRTVISPSWKGIGSGGSTGRPKVIITPTPAVFEEPRFNNGPLQIRPGEVAVVTAPLSHNGPFLATVTTLLLGGRVVLTGRFDPEKVLAAVKEESATWLYLVPTMMSRISKLPDETKAKYDASSLRRVVHMGAPCPEWLKREWISMVGPECLFEIYTSTEGLTLFLVDGVEWLQHPGTVGRPLKGQVEIRSADGSALPVGETGVVWMKQDDSGRPTYEYLGAKSTRDEAGWQSLGDMGRVDAQGYLYLADREADMILVGGSNVYPAEIEGALLDHRLVDDVVVFGLPHGDLGQAPHAVVYSSRGVSETELLDHVLGRLSSYKRPRSWEFVDMPLRDAAGKLNRRTLRQDRLEGLPCIAGGDPAAAKGQ